MGSVGEERRRGLFRGNTCCAWEKFGNVPPSACGSLYDLGSIAHGYGAAPHGVVAIWGMVMAIQRSLSQASTHAVTRSTHRHVICVGSCVALALATIGASAGASSAQPVAVAPVNAPDGALGTWSALGVGTNDLVAALAVDPIDDTLYIGGNFTTAGAVTTSGVARWDGSTWSDMSGGVTSGSDVSASSASEIL